MSATVWLVAVAGGVLTYLERLSFLGLADRAGALSPRTLEALRMIPPAALAALVAPAVLRSGTGGSIALADPRVLAAGLAMLAMWRTGNVLLTLGVGMGVLIGAQQLIG
jgi:branched-subunit amino acid transport protein